MPGPPTPATGPASPGAAITLGGAREVAMAVPGPPGARRGASSLGGGPSTVMETMLSPRRMISPSARRSSFSRDRPPPCSGGGSGGVLVCVLVCVGAEM